MRTLTAASPPWGLRGVAQPIFFLKPVSSGVRPDLRIMITAPVREEEQTCAEWKQRAVAHQTVAHSRGSVSRLTSPAVARGRLRSPEKRLALAAGFAVALPGAVSTERWRIRRFRVW